MQVGAIILLPTTSLIHICIDIKADNVLFLGPNTAEIEETIAKEPPLIDGSFTFQSGQYPILRSQPFHPRISWDASPFVAETIQVVLSDLGAGMQTLIPSGGINICNATSQLCGQISQNLQVTLVRSRCVHLRISSGLNAARRLTFGPLGAWYGDTQLPFMGSHHSLSIADI